MVTWASDAGPNSAAFGLLQFSYADEHGKTPSVAHSVLCFRSDDVRDHDTFVVVPMEVARSALASASQSVC